MRRTLLLIYITTVAEIVYSSEHTKRRAPLGFTGVRGKKSITDEDSSEVLKSLIENVGDPQATTASDGGGVGNMDKRAPSGFMGMRGKKPFPDPDEFPDDVIKRAPSAFFGMRGKKDAELDDLDEYKRSQYGFHGMRGKKDYENDDFLIESDKRAPSGFMGMRGKKAYIDEIKRAQMSNFYGMRGKKSKSGFFGMRGKKYPYELRGKFVGVRGKKSDEIEGNNDEYVDLNQLMLLLTANNRPTLGNGPV